MNEITQFKNADAWLICLDEMHGAVVEVGWQFVKVLHAGVEQFGRTDPQRMDLFQRAADQTGISPKTLQNWVSMYRSPAAAVAQELGLTIQHAKNVLGMEEEAAYSLLHDAAEMRYTPEQVSREAWVKKNVVPRTGIDTPPPPSAEEVASTYRSTNHRELATIQAAMDTVQRQRWPTTVGATGLPPVMRPHEHEALSTYANVTADMSKWMIGDHGLQVEREIDHLARLYKWAPEKRQANLSTKLSEAAAAHRMALDEFERHMETARMFGADMRRQSATVGYEHHYLLRNRTRAEAVEYLDRAERGGWTVQRLDEELHPQQPNEIAIFGSIRECVDITIEGNTITLTSTYGKLIITQWRIE